MSIFLAGQQSYDPPGTTNNGEVHGDMSTGNHTTQSQHAHIDCVHSIEAGYEASRTPGMGLCSPKMTSAATLPDNKIELGIWLACGVILLNIVANVALRNVKVENVKNFSILNNINVFIKWLSD